LFSAAVESTKGQAAMLAGITSATSQGVNSNEGGVAVLSQFLWVIFPYLALAVMIVGMFYRFAYGQRGWTSKSSEILEKKWLRRGSLLFHWGIILVFLGHVMGLLVPLRVYQALGVSSEFYHVNADVFGGIAGVVTFVGVLILLLRRSLHSRVRANSSVSDYVALVMILIVIAIGTLETVGLNNIFGPYEYRTTIGPWVRELMVLHPNAALMKSVPWVLKVHILAAFTLFAVWPFTRLVHVFSLPVRYPWRAPIQYRSRARYHRD